MADKEKCDEAKRILSSVWHSKREKERYDELIEKAISNAIKVTPSYSLAPGGGNPLEDKMAAFASEVDALTAKRDEMAKQYLREFMFVSDIIDRLDSPIHVAILRRRYLGDYKFEEIANELYLTDRRIFQLHHEAIEKVADMI